ncbi:MAG: hypothetical protein PHS93_01465 [Candidatus Omnitrophica bacterium]|nr:hypothetical protein [Candidatus Omnitrophota bacterium]MDD5351819.1 hypothetical protein [Candidatus Omnitrophota bacterium]MDD5550645.1 hypothetical protein [Candidatus Omnitrophota bacterium]
MKKQITLLIAAVFVSILLSVSFSLAEERITLTTYYPAPYGIYKELRADQMAVGSAYRNSALNNGTLIVSGKVGIGTDNPTAMLHVAGAGGSFRLERTYPPEWLSGMNFSFPSGYPTIYSDTGDQLRFGVNGSATPVITIASTGNVGIGTPSPAAKLHVAGTTQFDGDVSGLELEFYNCTTYSVSGGGSCGDNKVVTNIYSNGGDWGGGDTFTCCNVRVK